jgi:hypothetical protein
VSTFGSLNDVLDAFEKQFDSLLLPTSNVGPENVEIPQTPSFIHTGGAAPSPGSFSNMTATILASPASSSPPTEHQ